MMWRTVKRECQFCIVLPNVMRMSSVCLTLRDVRRRSCAWRSTTRSGTTRRPCATGTSGNDLRPIAGGRPGGSCVGCHAFAQWLRRQIADDRTALLPRQAGRPPKMTLWRAPPDGAAPPFTRMRRGGSGRNASASPARVGSISFRGCPPRRAQKPFHEGRGGILPSRKISGFHLRRSRHSAPTGSHLRCAVLTVHSLSVVSLGTL